MFVYMSCVWVCGCGCVFYKNICCNSVISSHFVMCYISFACFCYVIFFFHLFKVSFSGFLFQSQVFFVCCYFSYVVVRFFVQLLRIFVLRDVLYFSMFSYHFSANSNSSPFYPFHFVTIFIHFRAFDVLLFFNGIKKELLLALHVEFTVHLF